MGTTTSSKQMPPISEEMPPIIEGTRIKTEWEKNLDIVISCFMVSYDLGMKFYLASSVLGGDFAWEPKRENLFEAIKKMVISVDDNLENSPIFSEWIDWFIDEQLIPDKHKLEEDVQLDSSDIKRFMTSDKPGEGKDLIEQRIKLLVEIMQEAHLDPNYVAEAAAAASSPARIFGDELLTF